MKTYSQTAVNLDQEAMMDIFSLEFQTLQYSEEGHFCCLALLLLILLANFNSAYSKAIKSELLYIRNRFFE